jgi:dihydrofolate reductase
VLTRQAGWAAPGAAAAASLEQALAAAPGDVWVIGGATVYPAAVPFADRVELTELEQAFEGDARAPALGPEWQETARDPETGWHESRTGLRYRFRSLVRARQRRGPPAPVGR